MDHTFSYKEGHEDIRGVNANDRICGIGINNHQFLIKQKPLCNSFPA
jgi:hypothetical protein